MSKAYQCDRCKKCFNPSDMKEEESFIAIDHYWRQNRHDYAMHECWDSMDDLHLCPGCTMIFVSFMKGEEINETGQNTYSYTADHGTDSADINDSSFWKGGESGDCRIQSSDKAAERTKRAKKNSKH